MPTPPSPDPTGKPSATPTGPPELVDATAQPPAKPQKEKKRVPPGAILPDRGRPKARYWMNRRFGRPDLVPSLDPFQLLDLEEEKYIARLRFLAASGIQPVIAFGNIKSASKTSSALGVGNVIAEYTRKNTLVLPSTANSATATAGLMSGITGNRVTLSEYSAELKQFGAFRTLEQRVPRTKWGLGVIFEDDGSSAEYDDGIALQRYLEMVDVTLPNVAVLIIDLGNDNISKHSIALHAARLSHVLNFPFLFDNPVTHDMMAKTMQGYNTDAGIPDDVWATYYEGFEHKEFTGLSVSTRHKVESSIVIATKAGPGDDIDFDALTKPAKQSAAADDLPPWNGQGLRVPTDDTIGRKDKKTGELLPFNLDTIHQPTRIAYLKIAVANFEMAAVVQGVDLGSYRSTDFLAHRRHQ